MLLVRDVIIVFESVVPLSLLLLARFPHSRLGFRDVIVAHFRKGLRSCMLRQ